MRNSQQFTLELPSDPPFYENEALNRILGKSALRLPSYLRFVRSVHRVLFNHLSRTPLVSLLPGIDEGDGERVVDIGPPVNFLRCVLLLRELTVGCQVLLRMFRQVAQHPPRLIHEAVGHTPGA